MHSSKFFTYCRSNLSLSSLLILVLISCRLCYCLYNMYMYYKRLTIIICGVSFLDRNKDNLPNHYKNFILFRNYSLLSNPIKHGYIKRTCVIKIRTLSSKIEQLVQSCLKICITHTLRV